MNCPARSKKLLAIALPDSPIDTLGKVMAEGFPAFMRSATEGQTTRRERIATAMFPRTLYEVALNRKVKGDRIVLAAKRAVEAADALIAALDRKPRRKKR